MPTDTASGVECLKRWETKDALLGKCIDRAWSLLCESKKVGQLGSLDLHVVNFDWVPASIRTSKYFTQNCKALLAENVVIVNEGFLLELEAAIRAFDISASFADCQYLKHDSELYGLINTIHSDAGTHLSRLRSYYSDATSAEADILGEMASLLLFFVGHEVGHLLADVDQRSFGSFVGDDASAEQRIGNAVVKLWRHMDQFQRLGFGLSKGQQGGGYDESVSQPSYRTFRKANERLFANHDKWFEDEGVADHAATDICLDWLSRLDGADTVEAAHQQFLLFKALFVAAVYLWHKDLFLFYDGFNFSAAPTAQQLTFAMMKNREQYIKAAMLFGEVHGSLLLRVVLATEQILKQRSPFFETGKKFGSIWQEKRGVPSPDESPAIRMDWWLKECVERHLLLRLLLDTGVKIAYIGRSTGWLLEADRERGTQQVFMMDFWSIQRQVAYMHRSFG